MININNIAQYLESKLNDNSSGFSFRVFPSFGKYEEAVRSGNTITEYINCICNLQANEVNQLQNGKRIVSCTINVSYIIPLEDEDEDITETELVLNGNNEIEESVSTLASGNYSKLSALRDVFFNAFGAIENLNVTDNETTWNVTYIYTNPNDGERGSLAYIGYSFTMYQTIYVFIIENGVNERNIVYKLDGLAIPYEQMTTYRTPTIDGYVSSGDNGEVKNTASQYQNSWQFTLPSFDDELGGKIFNAIHIEAVDCIHILSINNIIKPVIFGQSSMQGTTGKNLSFTISLVTAPFSDVATASVADGMYLYYINASTFSLAHNSANDGIVGISDKGHTYDFGSNYPTTMNNGTYILTSGAVTGLENYLV